MRKSHIIVILLFVAMQLSGYLVPTFLNLFGITEETTPDLYVTSAIYYTIASYAIALILSIIILYRDRNEENRSLLGTHDAYKLGRSVLLVIGGFFLAWGSNIVTGLIEQLLFDVKPTSDNTQNFVKIIEMNPIFIIIPVLFAPIYEEIVFRYILFRTFMKKMHWVFASMFSSLIFGALHMEFEHILIYSGIGLVLAWIYMKSKRIYVPIAVHMILNSITLLVQMNMDNIEQFIKDLEQQQLN